MLIAPATVRFSRGVSLFVSSIFDGSINIWLTYATSSDCCSAPACNASSTALSTAIRHSSAIVSTRTGSSRSAATRRGSLSLPLLDLGEVAVVVPLAVRCQAIGIDDQAGRAHLAADAIDKLSGRLVDALHIGSRDLHGLDAERPGTGRDITGDLKVRWGALCVVVVFDHEQHRCRPEACQVHGFVDDPFAERAIAQKHGRHASGAELFFGVGHTDRVRDDSPLNAVGMEVPPAEMLAAADSAADTALLSHQFRDQAGDIAGIGDVMAVAAMVREDDILRSEMGDDADGIRLLPDTGMGCSEQLPLGEEFEDPLLRLTDELHHAITFDHTQTMKDIPTMFQRRTAIQTYRYGPALNRGTGTTAPRTQTLYGWSVVRPRAAARCQSSVVVEPGS